MFPTNAHEAEVLHWQHGPFCGPWSIACTERETWKEEKG